MRRLKNKRLVYVCCQLAGWSGMILYELANFVGMGYSWNWQIQQQFLLFGIIGIVLTHYYRKLLFRFNFWYRAMWWQLLIFSVFVVVISVVMYVLSALVDVMFNPKDKLDLINGRTLMYIINWSRYILVWMLCYHAYKLFERGIIKEVEKKEAVVQKQLLEMEVLRSQINPHFLFNTLNGIRSLINSSPQKARDAATMLSEVLRYTLNYEKTVTVSLVEELRMAEKYLQLEKLRFEDRLQYSIEAAEGTDHIQVPPVLVLTLVENAVKHGIGKLIEGGLLNIKVAKLATEVKITVENSGFFMYFLEEELGKGLLNTQKRLEFVYPGKGVFTIKNGSNGLVNATVSIPVVR
jgi:two-component system, LytTR family, sensor kinase